VGGIGEEIESVTFRDRPRKYVTQKLWIDYSGQTVEESIAQFVANFGHRDTVVRIRHTPKLDQLFIAFSRGDLAERGVEKVFLSQLCDFSDCVSILSLVHEFLVSQFRLYSGGRSR
jgi:hypothetical protein